MASANDTKLIMKNQGLINELLSKYPNQHSMCFIAGRYMCFLCVILDVIDETKGNVIQLFYDFKNNRSDAIKVCDIFVEKGDRTRFMELFDNYMVANYERDYNEVELILDEGLPQYFISPN